MSEWIVYSKDGLTERCRVKDFEYNGEFLGSCSINMTITSQTPIAFEIGDFLEYRGERFEINYDPSVIKQSSRDTHGEGFKYENVVFNSLSDELTRCDFLDYVPSDNQIHYTSLPTFSFFADNIGKLAERIQVNLDRIYKDDKKWTIIVHEEYVNKTNVNITANNITCWDALAFVKSEFDANFIIKGRTITIGTEGIAIGKIFSYGKGNGLISIERSAESEQKIITRLRAYGSTKNMPESYYKNLGMKVFFKIGEYSVIDQSATFHIGTKYNSLNLFTDVWKEQNEGAYTAYKIKVRLNDVSITAQVALNEGDIESYINVSPTYEPDNAKLEAFISELNTGKYSKLYVESGVINTAFPYDEREYLENIPNNMAVRNLMLPSFPENQDPYIDSKNIDELGVREGTVFFDGSDGLEEIYPTLPSENGINQIRNAQQIEDDGVFPEGSTIPMFEIYLNDLGFDINDHRSTAGNPIIAMKDGMCGGREFEVQSVEFDGVGYKATCNRSYDDSLDLYFPYNSYQIKSGDRFTLLNISMPDEYVQAASERLLEAANEYLAQNDYVRYSYSPKVDNIYMARQHEESLVDGGISIYSNIKEGDLMLFEDEDLGIDGSIIIDTLSIKESEGLIPQYEITLKDEKVVGTFEKIQNQIDSIVSGSLGVKGGGYNTSQIKSIINAYGSSVFLRKDKDDTASGNITFKKQIKSEDFIPGLLIGSGWSVYRDANGNTVVEADRMVVRKDMTVNDLVVNQETFNKGGIIYVKAGCSITSVEDHEGFYRCYYDNKNGNSYSGFKEGDQARCQRYDQSYENLTKYYWRLVVGVGNDYVDLSKTDCDGVGVPKEGDDIAQLGSRYDKTRQSAIVISPDNGGSVIIWAGIDSFDLSEKNMVGMGVNPNTGRAYLYGYGDMFFGDRSLEKNYITYQTRDGETEPTLNINADIHFGKGSDGLSNLSEFKDIQNDVDNLFGQIEREFTIWYYDYEPTLDNEPAVNWVTDSDKALHDQDIFFSDKLARAWRFVNGAWVEITDERTLAALKISEDAHAAASEAEKNAREAKEYIDNILPSKLEELQNQIDGAIESFFYKYDPTTSNEPASFWTTEEQKAMHLNDTFTNLESGYSWRWTVNGGVYGWTEISDTATVKALVAAGQAQDTADQKRRVFVATPYTPYDEGDLWVQGENGDIMRCSKSRASGNFVSSDWIKASKYTDNSALEAFIQGDYKNQLASIQFQMDKRAETWYQVEDPSLAWTTQELKQLHAGDLWYNINKGLSYMWSGTEWVIQGVPDEVFDTIDGKASIYTSQPSSYKKNDLWILSSDTTLDKAYKSGTIVVAKQDSDTFVASHWTKKDRYTDDSALETFLNGAYKEQLAVIQSQIDNRAETWYQSADPSLQWTTDALKQQHVGDLWYDINKAQSFMWNGSEWVVQGVPDEVYDKIDGKSSIYTSQPSAYKKNDLWILASDTTLDKAYKSGTIVVAKQDSDVFVKEHWTKKDCYTDDSAVTEFINGAYKTQIEEIKGQIDKKSETWYQNTDPSLNWDTTQKNEHKGDLWYNTNEDQTYIWSGTIWIPQGVPDEVFDKIDGKAQIFASRPNSYNKNDLWVLEQDMTLDKDYKKGTIVIAATSSNYFVATHWTKLDRYTDDSRADEAYGKAEEAYRKAESFSEDLSGVLADMDVVMNQVDREFTIWYYNHVPTLNNAPAVDWDTDEEKQRHDQDICFADELAKAWRFVNGQWVEITDERTLAALKISEDAKSDAEDAKKDAEEAKEQATAAANRVANVEYLKDTFGKNETIIDGGVYISKLVSVKNEEENIEAFLNGSDVGKDAEHGKLILAGGIPESGGNLEERSRNALTRIYEDGHIVSKSANIEGTITATNGELGGFTIGSKSLENDKADAMVSIGTDTGGKFVRINEPYSTAALYVRHDSNTAIGVYTDGSTGVGVRITAQTGAKAIESYGNCLIRARSSELITINGAAYATDRAFSGTVTSNMDIIITNGNTTLPLASSCKGKVYYVKILGGTLTVKNVYLSNSSSVTTTGIWTDANARIFFSDGTYWYEINGA